MSGANTVELILKFCLFKTPASEDSDDDEDESSPDDRGDNFSQTDTKTRGLIDSCDVLDLSTKHTTPSEDRL